MKTNVEIKARARGLGALRDRALGLGARPHARLAQLDTFFRVARGRLKLRELGGDAAELIFYERPDRPGPKRSDYWRAPVSSPKALRELLAAGLGVRGTVEKQREVLLLAETRIHLDAVVGLGDFLELEVVLSDGQSPEEGDAIARRLLDGLGVGEDALVAGAYLDLLEATGGDAPDDAG